ncbi:MAG TPA: demethoxyubiquinone hydroxylase family protein [Caulobacteraceae bacterium]|jgi:ubiquinone biosynthesis monooxygenase Coq7|nr:demethoxyubiquinone hydroxylase family protein [Caulobacteraceae bacterium]
MSERPIPPRPGPGGQEMRLAQMLRVDHAGELGAVHIYRGQRAVLGEAPGRASTAATLAEMEDHEARHLARFDELLVSRGVRPTLLAPFWRAAGFALGAGTALLGEKAAHACTDAVESVIEEHYAGQVAEIGELEPELAGELSEFRDDELDHQRLAIENGAREAPGARLLTAVIRAGCRAAIKISERI